MGNNYTVVLMSTSEVLFEKEFETLVDAFDFYMKIDIDQKTNVAQVLWDNNGGRYVIRKNTDIYNALTTCSTGMVKRLKDNGHNEYLSIYKLPQGL